MPSFVSPPATDCFVGFYGLDRSLRWTSRSIRRNVLQPLSRAGFNCVLAGHFNRPEVIHHPASGERGVKVRHRPAKHLDLDLVWTEPQSESTARDLVDIVLSAPFRDYDDPTGGTRRNIAYQLHSLRRLGELADLAGGRRFSVFVLLRPDIEYIDPIDIDLIRKISRGEVDFVTPSWHLWGGMNDRFGFGNYDAAKAFLNRSAHLSEFCRKHSFLHPESLLKESMEAAGVRVALTDQRALRVRATGETWAEGFRLPKTTRLIHRARPLMNVLPGIA